MLQCKAIPTRVSGPQCTTPRRFYPTPDSASLESPSHPVSPPVRKFDRTVAALVLLASVAPVAFAAPPAASPPSTSSQQAAPTDTSAVAPIPGPPKLPFPRRKPDPLDEPYSPAAAAGPQLAVSAAPAAASAIKPFPHVKPMTAVATIPLPRSKPAPATLAMASTPPTQPTTAPVTSAPPAVPHVKPISAKPFPRPKPDLTPAIAMVPAASSVSPPSAAPALVPAAAATAPAPAAPDANACGEACNEILFRTLDNCLWVQNANPKPVMFAAQVDGRTISLALAGADAAKADAHKPFEPKEGVPSPIGEGAYHTRISDPFSPSAPGIAVYRARLGNCVKSRTEVTSFTASFAKPSAGK